MDPDVEDPMPYRIREDRYEEMAQLQRYRRDRRVLLRYVCETTSAKKVIMPPGAVTLDDIDIDALSVDYVLEMSKTRDILDLAESMRRNYVDMEMPPSHGEGDSETFLLVTNPKLAGAPPDRPAPPPPPVGIVVPPTPSKSPAVHRSMSNKSPLAVTPRESFGPDEDVEALSDDEDVARRKLTDTKDFQLDLPLLQTGLSDDDLRETAYEVLLASVGNTGVLTPAPKAPEKKEKRKLLRRSSKSKKDTPEAVPEHVTELAALLEVMRGQMEVSEAADRRIKDALLQAAVARPGRRMDTVLVPLEMLSGTPPTEFASKRDYIRWEKRHLNLLQEGLILHPSVPMNSSAEELAYQFRHIVVRIEESANMPSPAGPQQHVEALRDLRSVALGLAERSNRGESVDDACHWADGYPLNVRIYEHLLRACFDVLDESQIVDEVDDILELVKNTWRILGITPMVHDVCWAWVLFRQFILTQEDELLAGAGTHLKKLANDGGRSAQERAYMQLLRTPSGANGSKGMSWVQSALQPIKDWVDHRLRDYHSEFPEGGKGDMEGMLAVGLYASKVLLEEDESAGWGAKNTAAAERMAVTKQVEEYVRASLKAAYHRAVQSAERQVAAAHSSGIKHEVGRLEKSPSGRTAGGGLHDIIKQVRQLSEDEGGRGGVKQEPLLAVLARQVRQLAQEEASSYSPVLLSWSIGAKSVAAETLHKLFRADLKPYLDGVSTLNDEAKLILPAAESLEDFLLNMSSSVLDDPDEPSEIVLFGVGDVSATLIMRWVNGQLSNLSTMAERSLQVEEWEPMSPQQRYANSIVEVFRIMEETLDQFFGMALPMRASVLKGLTTGFDNALQQYANKIVAQCGAKEDLIPSAPPLTRYKKDIAVKTIEKAALRRILTRLADEQRQKEIDSLTIPTLCIRLNTLHFLLGQVEALENSIRERWAAKNPRDPLFSKSASSNGQRLSSDLAKSKSFNDSQVELFSGTAKTVGSCIDKVSDFLGAKVVFYDLRGPFLESLYVTSVTGSRMEKVITELDPILSSICEVIAGPLRDRTVLALFSATLEGLQRVLLDGGPTRVFLVEDGDMLEEDLTNLKDFFVADGDGLPRHLVEVTAAQTAQVLHLFELQTDALVENFQTASKEMAGNGASSTGLPSSSGQRSATDADTLLRVLCHRGDREASKFLKKSYKLPKTV